MGKFGIHWFRRDLRVAGNPALSHQWKVNDGKVVGLFCFDKSFLKREDFSVNRFQFFIATLIELKKELRKVGSDLLVMDEGPFDAFPRLLEALKEPPSLVSWNRDYEPFAVQRDKKAQSLFAERGIATFTDRDHLLIEPHEIFRDGNPELGYQVYSPFARKWREVFVQNSVQNRIEQQARGLVYLSKLKKEQVEPMFRLKWKGLVGNDFSSNVLETYQKENQKRVTIAIPKAGSLVALAAVKVFANKIGDYSEARDIPSVPGTSQLSIYLKNGSLTVGQVIAELELEAYGKKAKTSADKYFSELMWREFYYHILARHPRVEHSAFLEKYENLKWENDSKKFRAWTEGKTGYPIVDAGMRQLNETGWMHNRVRMIVASFLTKDLLIDWRWGEAYFMDKLLDGDLAPNNGGWQWAASTGCDAQPYFRIFNPYLQSKRFDPEGAYIRKYVPELQKLSAKQIHEPSGVSGYPEPIVDHSEQREKALKMYDV